jgi:phosphofructokinase-like protein
VGAKIGVLTGGGDCPGLNAVIRAVVRRGLDFNITCFGFRNGWQGVLEGTIEPLTLDSTRGILGRGGTILGTSRVNPIAEPGGVERIQDVRDFHSLDGFVVIGGEGTLSAATALHFEHGVPLVGIPKTIDNDLGGTDYTVGFATARDIATEAVDRLHSTAESHKRVMLLEVMGRHAGWIATFAGIAGGADAILIPEQPFEINRIIRHIKHRAGAGRIFSIVVIAEGAVPKEGTLELPEYHKDRFGRPVLGGIAHVVREVIEERTGFETRETILGHVQRGGAPNAFDRVLGTRFGVAAVEMVNDGRWGLMTGLHGNDVVGVDLRECTRELKTVPKELYEVAEVFFG